MSTDANPYRNLPSVDDLVAETPSNSLPSSLLVDVARTAIELARKRIASGAQPDITQITADVIRQTELSKTQKVINATGVLLHTNLGRAALSQSAAKAMSETGGSFSNIELNLEDGSRGGRGRYVAELLRVLTGAEDALVVNNNASAVLLSLAATARGRSVPVARGELIEIGGSYRLPELMAISGARLVEVGTTNRVRVGDYQTALQTHTCSAILKVHPSNYRVEGFTEEASVAELSELANKREAVLIHDVGSGLLDSDASWLGYPIPEWLADEPAVRQSLVAGADLVTFSGDKLIGGPQAGVVVGKRHLVESLRRDPLARALRVSGPVEASLAATLESYANGTPDDIPFWSMALTSQESIRSRSQRISESLGGSLTEGVALVGAGSVPGTGIATTEIVLEGEDHLYLPLLRAIRPVASRREAGNLLLDLRSVEEADDGEIIEMIRQCR